MRIVYICLLTMSLSCATSSKLTVDKSAYDYLQANVEVIVDKYGIPHIYAESQTDLFFAQGYHAARDRLFQFEIWRRQATGTMAEIMGQKEFKRDLGTRLFRFRKNIIQEMNHYHDDGAEIISSYVEGVNQYISEARLDQDNLPIEFKLLNILPEFWTPEVVISRHQGLLGNINSELDIARAVAISGPELVKELLWFHPKDPSISLDSIIDKEHLQNDILELYNAFRQRVRFAPEDVSFASRNDQETYKDLVEHEKTVVENEYDIGSNNWVITGERTESGFPLMANDPHRSLQVPSLRYMCHLVAPGWNVIGGGEPEIPGISIGHNEYGAWGLTVFRSDAEDLYVYQLNPENSDQYWYKEEWHDFQILEETIKVKANSDQQVELRYSVHGPVCYLDKDRDIAYAVKCGWLEYGGSPYLASLRMDQSRNFDEFREACTYSNIPGENMVWADKNGNIGWQVVGINPIRRTHSGLVPVPGDGRYDWGSYIHMKQRPNDFNPISGLIITANESVTPDNYEEWDAIGFNWSDPYRGMRVKEVIGSKKKHSIEEMAALQSDYYSIPARELLPVLFDAYTGKESLEWAIGQLNTWDYVLSPTSVAASIYVTWERLIKQKAWEIAVPQNIKDHVNAVQLKRVIDWIIDVDYIFSTKEERDDFLLSLLEESLQSLENRFGDDRSKWQYGSPKFKHVTMRHPLSAAVTDELRKVLEVGPAPRGGYGYTVGSTGTADNQPSGGTFRIIIDTGNWDAAVANNSPGQSGNPEHQHYKNLFEDWSQDKYFPLYYSKDKVKSIEDYRYVLEARNK